VWHLKKDKTGHSERVNLLSKANVDCPDQIEVGHWYDPKYGTDRLTEEKALSFSCGSTYKECCRYLRHDKGVFKPNSRPKTFNNRPMYVDENREYCIIYYRKQWMVVNCKLFFSVDFWNNSKGVLLLSKANVDCPDQIVGDMHWYKSDGNKTDVSYSCDMLSTTPAKPVKESVKPVKEPVKPVKPVKPVRPAKKLLPKSFTDDFRPVFGGY